MLSFAEECRIRESPEGATLPLGAESAIWGVCGGYVAAAALRWACAVSGLRPASISCDFLAALKPQVATVTNETILQRPGLALLEVRVSQQDRLCMVARVWLREPRPDSPQHTSVADFSALDHQDFATLMEKAAAPGGYPPPLFFQSWFDLKMGPASAEVTEAFNWFRYPGETTDPVLTAAQYLPLIDIMGVTAFRARYGSKFVDAASPTLQLAVHFYGDAVSDGWTLAKAAGVSVADGIISTEVETWSESGLLLAKGISQMRIPA